MTGLPLDIASVPGLRLRPFADDADFPAMAITANASFAADGMGWVRTPEQIQRDYARFVRFEPARDIVMAEVDGRLAGYVRTSDWTTLDGAYCQGQVAMVDPAFRRRGIGRVLLRWVEERQRELARAQPQAPLHWHHVWVTEGEKARVRLLERAGYRVARHFLEMQRPHLDGIEDLPLPPGFEVRPVEPHQLRAIFDAHMTALRGHWGMSTEEGSDFERWKTLRMFQPHLWQVAWHIESGQVAGQVKPWIDHEQNETQGRLRGYTEFISVGEPWRRRGLARALIMRALRAQRDAGMRESALGVDGDNAYDAARLYERCGFEVVKRNAVYRKPVDLAAG